MSEPGQSGGSHHQRSRNGCLTCRRKRKKCDEKLPVCLRCEKGDSQCVWPQCPRHLTSSALNVPSEEISTLPTLPAGLRVDSANGPGVYSLPFANSESLRTTTGITSPTVGTKFGDSNITGGLDSNFSLPSDSDQIGSLPGLSTLNNDISPCGPLVWAHSKHLTLKIWEYAQEYGPRIIWPPQDPKASEDFDPEGVMNVLNKSIDFLTRTVILEPVFQEMVHFYSTFLSRFFYDYAIIPEGIVEWMLQRFKMSNSAKYGMLATAVLFRANYERSPLTDALRSYAKELHALASQQIALDLKNDDFPPQVKLIGLMEIANYEYYSNTLSRYYLHVLEAASVVRQIIGGDTLDPLDLSGKHTFDVRRFAWCDILHSMATSRPTMLKYESNIERVRQIGLEDGYANPEKGVEWIYGCPDVLTVLIARITALRHSPAPKEEKVLRGAELEQLVLNWEFRPTRAKGSVMRVARLGVQETWRHSTILYLHQAIFQSDPTHPTVRNSVRNIVKIAYTLKPGVNPDCFLSVPYFIAGSFAMAQNDRYTLRSRILSCGNERFLRSLASSLDDIWAESDATGRFTSWSDKEPPTIIF